MGAGAAVGAGMAGTDVGVSTAAAPDMAIAVGATGGVEGAPVYTVDGLGDGAGEEETTVVTVGAGGVVGATVGALVGVAVSCATATAGAIVGAAGAAGTVVVGVELSIVTVTLSPHATTNALIAMSTTTARLVSGLLVNKCQFPDPNE